ncbi:MAG TPA: hypothetical protein PLY80_08845 [Pseudomonadota bacterium]|nr:hypothetical protein [Pseudomonadota bacterium]
MSIAWPLPPQPCVATGVPAGCTPPPVVPTLPFPSHHVEMYAYYAGNPKPERIIANVGGQTDPQAFSGFQVLPVVDPSEPCAIRGLDRDDGGCGRGSLSASTCGAQYYTQKAQRATDDEALSDVTLAGRDQLLLQVGKVVSKLTPFPSTNADLNLATKGRAATTMLVLVQHNPDNANEPRRSGALMAITPTTAEDDAESERRLNVCKAYRDGGHPNFYVGNPKQYTKPLSGVLFGMLLYQTGAGTAAPDLPTQNFSGITFSVPTNMKDLIEIQIRIEPDNDKLPNAIYYPVIQGRRLPDSAAGRGAIKFAMYANTNGPGLPTNFSALVGSASVETQLDARLQ